MPSQQEIRQAFLAFFANKGHTIVPSSPLVPSDPTLLFTNAGMVQFKDAFLGLESPARRDSVSVQKCMRVSGKHNDLEQVGPSPYHHTFFEMLGNFSFGGYFKEQAIAFAWEFITGELGLPPDRLIFTVHKDDEEALNHWRQILRSRRIPEERILRLGDKTNFWMMGDTGPCGPTSEIHYDFGPEYDTCKDPKCSVALDNGCLRWLELWNLVFMQFDQRADGSRVNLPKPGVDTGMSLERIAAVVQGVVSNYETDLFMPIIERVQDLLGHSDAERQKNTTAYRVIADHGRAMTFLIADGVLPGNEERSYVLRMIMRRAMRFGRRLGFGSAFLGQVVEAVIETMRSQYPELVQQRGFILEVIGQEEERFQHTLDTGLALVEEIITRVKASKAQVVPGTEVFRLWDTYGFPPELTEDIAREHGLMVDRAGYEGAMAEQRQRARAAAKFVLADAAEFYRQLNLQPTTFLGYDYSRLGGAPAKILALSRNSQVLKEASVGEQIAVVLDQTPFYAEAGGQEGDTGYLTAMGGRVQIVDTQSPLAGLIVHWGRVVEGSIRRGEEVVTQVDVERRWDIMRNHTATHLLHKALRKILGEHAQQRGSLVALDRLRFDFAHLKAVTPEELLAIEQEVNARIREDLPVSAHILPKQEALTLGAVALFGEKYGDEVRMVEICDRAQVPTPPPQDCYSRELCGGTHLERTGQVGALFILSEGSIGAGLRRIEAVTGRGAEAYVHSLRRTLDRVAQSLGAPVDELDRQIESAASKLQESSDMIRLLKQRLALRNIDLHGKRSVLNGVEAVIGNAQIGGLGVPLTKEELRSLVDPLKKREKSIVVIYDVQGDRGIWVASVSSDLVKRGFSAKQLIEVVVEASGGGGGGKDTLAEAGGGDPARLEAAVQALDRFLREKLGNP